MSSPFINAPLSASCRPRLAFKLSRPGKLGGGVEGRTSSICTSWLSCGACWTGAEIACPFRRTVPCCCCPWFCVFCCCGCWPLLSSSDSSSTFRPRKLLPLLPNSIRLLRLFFRLVGCETLCRLSGRRENTESKSVLRLRWCEYIPSFEESSSRPLSLDDRPPNAALSARRPRNLRTLIGRFEGGGDMVSLELGWRLIEEEAPPVGDELVSLPGPAGRLACAADVM